MGIIKSLFLIIIFGLAVYMGNFKANQYTNRLKELVSIKTILNIFESKIKFTQSPLREIFGSVAESCSEKNIQKIFRKLATEKEYNMHEKWEKVIKQEESNLNSEDKKILIEMGKILGSTDIDGQVSNIKIATNFIDKQIEKAEKEKEKNAKMFRTLGILSRIGNNNNFNIKGEKTMDINLLFKIAAIGILVAVIHQVLVRAGRDDQAMMTTLAGVIIVLSIVIKEISTLFETVRTLFNL